MTDPIPPKWSMEESSLIMTEGYEDDTGAPSRIHSISDPYQSPVTSTEEEDENPRIPPWSQNAVRVFSAGEDLGGEEEEECEMRTTTRPEVEKGSFAMGPTVSNPFHPTLSGNDTSKENPTHTIPILLPGESSMQKSVANVAAPWTSADAAQRQENEEKTLSCPLTVSANPGSDGKFSSMGSRRKDSCPGVTPQKRSSLKEEEGTASERMAPPPAASTSLVSSSNEPVSWNYALACMHYCISMLCLENYGSPPHKDSPFHSSNIPECSILDYVKRIADHPCFSPTAIIAGILLIFRFMAARFPVDIYCAHRLLLTGASVGSLMYDDRAYSVGYVSSLGGIALRDLVAIQRVFCEVLKWNLLCYREDYDEFLAVMKQLLENPSEEEMEQFCATHKEEIASFDDARLKVVKGMKWFLKDYEKDSHRSGYHRSRASGGGSSSSTSFSRESAGKSERSGNSSQSVTHSDPPSELSTQSTAVPHSSSQSMQTSVNSSGPRRCSSTQASDPSSQLSTSHPPMTDPAHRSSTSLANKEEEDALPTSPKYFSSPFSTALQQTRVSAVLAIHRWNTIFQPWLEEWKKRCALREEKEEQSMQEDRDHHRRECQEENRFSTPPKAGRALYSEKSVSSSSSSFGASALYRPPAPPAATTNRGLPQLSSGYTPYSYEPSVLSTAYSTAPSSSSMGSKFNASLSQPGAAHGSTSVTSPTEGRSVVFHGVGTMQESSGSSGTVGQSAERMSSESLDATYVSASRPYYPSHYYPSASPLASTTTSGTTSVRGAGPFSGSRSSHMDPTFHVTNANTNAYTSSDTTYFSPSQHRDNPSATTTSATACGNRSGGNASFLSMSQSSKDIDAGFSSAPAKKNFTHAGPYAYHNTGLSSSSSFSSTVMPSSYKSDTLAPSASSSLALFSSSIKNGAAGEVHRKRTCSNSFQRFPEGSVKRVEVEDRWKEVQQMAKPPIGRKRCKPKYFKDLFE